MTRATVRELHTKTNDIVNEVAGGEVFIIEIEGSPLPRFGPSLGCQPQKPIKAN